MRRQALSLRQGAALAGASLAVAAMLAGSAAGSPAPFVPVVEPIGIAFTQGHMLVSHPWCGNPREVLRFNPNGGSTVLATLPPFGGCREDYIAVSPPNANGYPANRVFVAQGPNVYKVSGGSTTLFVTLSAPCADHTGLTFDTVGLFGGSSGAFPGQSLIATCEGGEVFAVGPFGGPTVTLVANVGSFIENPAVAPAGFTPVGGDVLVASETTSSVYAVSPSGTSSFVASWPSAEGVNAIPTRNGSQPPCSWGTPSQEFFTTVFTVGGGNVTGFPASENDFAGLNGDALVTSETGAGIGLLVPTGSLPITPSLFSATLGQPEGSAFHAYSPGCQ